MISPKTIKEVQRLNSRVVSLSRFQPRGEHRYRLFIQLLQKIGRTIVWTRSYEEAFYSLKEQLAWLLIL